MYYFSFQDRYDQGRNNQRPRRLRRLQILFLPLFDLNMPFHHPDVMKRLLRPSLPLYSIRA